MGKGDMKTKKGKIAKGSFGVTRPHKKANGGEQPVAATKKKTTTKKAASKK